MCLNIQVSMRVSTNLEAPFLMRILEALLDVLVQRGDLAVRDHQNVCLHNVMDESSGTVERSAAASNGEREG